MSKFMSSYIEDLVHVSGDVISEFLRENEGNLMCESNKLSGGQMVGWGDLTLHLTHLSTGIKVTCWEHRSRHINRQICIIRLILEINKHETS